MHATRFVWAAAALCASGIAQAQPTVVDSFATGAVFSAGIAFDPVTEETWIIDGNTKVISCFDPSGVPHRAFLAPVPPNGTEALPVGGSLDIRTGNLWVIDESEDVLELDPSGNVLRAWSAAPWITDGSGLAIDPENRILLVSDDSANVIQRFEFDGTVIGSPIDVGRTASSVDGDGLICNWLTRSLWIGEDTGDRLLEVDITGNHLSTISLVDIADATTGGTVTVSPEGMTIDTARGHILVSSSEGAIVYRIANVIPPAVLTVTRFGVGCADPGGSVPVLGMNGLIQENSSYDFVVQTSVPAGSNAQAFFVIGAAPVAIDLGLVGAAGCTLLAQPDIGTFGPVTLNANQRAGFGLSLGVGLGGLTLSWQAVIMPSDMSAVLGVSNGLTTTIQN